MLSSRAGNLNSLLSSVWQSWKMGLVVLGAILFSAGLAQADPLVIRPGYNFMATAPGSHLSISLPRGFFGNKGSVPSDAVVEQVIEVNGRPMGKLGLGPASGIIVEQGCHGEGGHGEWHCHKTTDQATLVDTITRVGGTTLNQIGDSATVPLQFVALSLETARTIPVRVTYGKAFPTLYKMILTLDSSELQEMGSIILTRTSENGGVMEVTLPVKFKASFSGNSSRNKVLGPVKLRTVLKSSDNQFTVRDR